MKISNRVIHSMLMLFPIISFYGVRLWWWAYLDDLRKPLGPAAIGIIIPLGTVALTVCIIIGITIALSIHLSKSMIPTSILMFGIAVILLLPLPESQKVLPETQHFLQYRADYEYILDLARSGQLDDSSENYCKYPPESYKHVSEAGCIHIDAYNGFVVKFNPIEPFYHPVVYIENDGLEDPCPDDDLHLEEKLDDHWYVCWREWN